MNRLLVSTALAPFVMLAACGRWFRRRIANQRSAHADPDPDASADPYTYACSRHDVDGIGLQQQVGG